MLFLMFGIVGLIWGFYFSLVIFQFILGVLEKRRKRKNHIN